MAGRCTTLLVFLVSARATAQGAHPLAAPTAKLGAEFTRILSVRELRDGRLLIADGGDGRLVVAEFARNTIRDVGRRGQGPGEFSAVTSVYALGGDSSVMADILARRWLILDEDRIVGTLPPDTPAIKATGSFIVGADGLGGVLAIKNPPTQPGLHVIGASDSSSVLRVGLASGRDDTIARLLRAPARVDAQALVPGRTSQLRVNRPPLSVGEEALLFPDGWVAIGRLNPYRVDWRAPDGRWVRGDPLPNPVVKFDARERQAYIARRTAASGKPPSFAPDEAWPATVPPFQPAPLVALPDGALLVARTPTAEHPESRYDHVDRRGRLLGQIRVAANERILAVGLHGVYVVATDDDGIQRIQRQPWP